MMTSVGELDTAKNANYRVLALALLGEALAGPRTKPRLSAPVSRSRWHVRCPRAGYVSERLRSVASPWRSRPKDLFAEARRIKRELVKIAQRSGGAWTGLIEAANQGLFFIAKGDRARSVEARRQFRDGIMKRADPDSRVGRLGLRLQIADALQRARLPEARALIEVAMEGAYAEKASRKERAALEVLNAELLLLEGKLGESERVLDGAARLQGRTNTRPGPVVTTDSAAACPRREPCRPSCVGYAR